MDISVIVPVYNEEQNIPEFLRRTIPILEGLASQFEIIFAMDPSSDRTEEVILERRAEDPRIKLLKFSRRFGQPMATLAGLQYCQGDAAIVIDVDLQDPPELIAEMVAAWRSGYDVVLAKRRSRRGRDAAEALCVVRRIPGDQQDRRGQHPRQHGRFPPVEPAGGQRTLAAEGVPRVPPRDGGPGRLPPNVDSLRSARPIHRPRQLQPLFRLAAHRIERADLLFHLPAVADDPVRFPDCRIVVLPGSRLRHHETVRFSLSDGESHDCDLGPLHGRNPIDLHRHSRGIHRADLRGGAAAAEVHRRFRGGILRRPRRIPRPGGAAARELPATRGIAA